MNIEITDHDISYAESLLLPAGCGCNEERRAFIRCMESRDVVACPGSGKTTALLAKLLILARKMPFADGRGVCVLTHTNVAIDTIKQRAAAASVALFQYPNYFGTIQSFVDRFLAAPSYRCEFNKPIVAIDNERFYAELGRLYHRDPGLQMWLEHRGGLQALGDYWFHPDSLLVGETLDSPLAKPSQGTPSYNKIQSMRRSVLEKGVLSFNDAYAMALRYCLRMPCIAQAVSSRFCMVFLDEAQDTEGHQLRVMDTVFRPEQLVVQRIGDPNQAIYSGRARGDDCWTPRDPLHFSDSRRYGASIARLLSSVRLDDSISLRPCETAPSHPPYLITFEADEEQSVIRAFSYLIDELSDTLPANGTYKAVGWIGQDKTSDGKLCVPSYCPGYDSRHRARARRFGNLVSYVGHAASTASTEGAKHFLEVILQGVADALNAVGIRDEVAERDHTPTSADYCWRREHEQSYYQFRDCLARYYLLALGPGFPPTALRDQIISAMGSIWPMQGRPVAYLNDNAVDSPPEVPDHKDRLANCFVGDNGVVVRVGTVHSVKGETHTGTLFMETSYYGKTDGQRLVRFLQGERPRDELGKVRHKDNLKIAHVAFSRPTHLLAFACRLGSVAGHEEQLQQNGWLIRTVPGLISHRRETQ